ncbi:unnamed protein product [Paramecium primaurelia]|uniref:Phosphatidic acid phosphatase type 2/haloperoxidase domain-containing protein n=1 Tax=Paramecium primaurelia TaxID=5886 RepID=A0A8S1PB36_PARPR|nr:unnamed protein product [Paramecium primaurelia]
MIKFCFSTLILIIYIYLDYNYGDQSFEISNRFTIFLQEQFEFGNLKGFIELIFYVFSTLGDRNIMYYILIFLWLKQANKLQTLQLIIMYSISSFFGDFIKMILKQPRPFYIDNKIQLDFCQYGFGGPSGHACRALVFYVILFKMLQTQYSDQQQDFNKVESEELYLMIQPEQQQKNEISLKNQIIRSIILILFILFTGIARVYFGVHFLNQVILGWIMGLYLLFIFYNCEMQNKIKQLLIQAIQKEPVKIYQIILIIYLIIIITASFIIYQGCINSQILNQLKQNWKDMADFQQKCNGNDKIYNTSFEKHDIIGISIITFPYFIFISLLYKKGIYEPQLYSYKFFTKKGIIRTIILIIGLMLPYYFRKQTKQFLLQLDSNIVVQFFFIGLLYFFELTLLLIYLIPLINKLLKVDNPGDLLNYQPKIEEQYEVEL